MVVAEALVEEAEHGPSSWTPLVGVGVDPVEEEAGKLRYAAVVMVQQRAGAAVGLVEGVEE